jgi:glutathione-regulated potassium-efflux system ancillary protein KefG
MARTCILVFHPDLATSTANAAMAGAAEPLPDTAVIDMTSLYPTGEFDRDAEVDRLLSAGRIVLQFPVQWYATPPLLKAWQDAVLTRMFYLRYEQEGRQIAGKPLLVAATAGNTPEAYSASGVNLFPLGELLRPLEATAHRCGLVWQPPFLVYRANRLTAEDAIRLGERYARRLASGATAPVGGDEAGQRQDRARSAPSR